MTKQFFVQLLIMTKWLKIGKYFQPKGWFVVFSHQSVSSVLWEKIVSVVKNKSIPNILSASRPSEASADSDSQIFVLNVDTDEELPVRSVARQIAQIFSESISDRFIFKIATKPKETHFVFSKTDLLPKNA